MLYHIIRWNRNIYTIRRIGRFRGRKQRLQEEKQKLIYEVEMMRKNAIKSRICKQSTRSQK